MTYFRSNIDFQLFVVFVVSSIVFGYDCCDSYVIQPKIWEYKSRYDIGYEVAFATDKNRDYDDDNDAYDTNEPILLLNGFGVGSFHQHRLIPHLLRRQDDDNSAAVDGGVSYNQHRTIYCVDYLGQGRSWPIDCRDGLGESEKDLQYSADTWVEQIIDFIEHVILVEEEKDGHLNKIDDKEIKITTSKKKVHLVGNSVGGHIAAHIARRRPDLISSICLLNPTPVWGSKLPGWNGHLPAPVIPKAVGRYLFDRIRDLKTVEQFLEATYSRKEALTQELMHQIRNCTLGNGGHAAFASIMWSPPLNSYDDGRKGNFQDCLSQVACDVFLVYGQDDPWCKPAFAKNMLKALEERRKDFSAVHRYVEISNAGHCPNHEAPQAVGHLVQSWVGAKDRSKEQLSLIGTTASTTSRQQQQHHKTFREEWGEHSIFEYDREDIKLGWVDRFVTSFM